MSEITDKKKHYVKDGIQKEAEKPQPARKEIVNRRGNAVIPRKYHMTDKQKQKFIDRFAEVTVNVDDKIKKKAGSGFFNPYRQAGVYYGCVQALYLLGANEWHRYLDICTKMEEVMSQIIDKKTSKSSWQKFSKKGPRLQDGSPAISAKDTKGRIEQNMRVLQRLGGLHPYGLKLSQIQSCIDVRRCKDGAFEYRLRTKIKDEVSPILDLTTFPKMKKVKGNAKETVLSSEKVDVA